MFEICFCLNLCVVAFSRILFPLQFVALLNLKYFKRFKSLWKVFVGYLAVGVHEYILYFHLIYFSAKNIASVIL